MKKSLIRQLKSEDWVIVGAGAAILLLALLFPRWMPAMPKDLSSAGNWMSAGAMFLFLLVLTGVCQRILGRPLRRFAVSLLAIFGVALLSQAVASIPAIKRLGFEAVFFSVIFGLVISNFFRVPEWLKPAIQSEFYIKIGIVCLGATILFGEVLQSGVYALIQAFIVVFTVWYFAFWLARRMRVDEETSTMLASSVSICGVSAAIATCGVIRGDNKKLLLHHFAGAGLRRTDDVPDALAGRSAAADGAFESRNRAGGRRSLDGRNDRYDGCGRSVGCSAG